MGAKLTLDIDRLQVVSFEAGDAEAGRGTVRAHDATGAAVCGTGGGCASNTNCFTTPCCAPTVTCPPPTFTC